MQKLTEEQIIEIERAIKRLSNFPELVEIQFRERSTGYTSDPDKTPGSDCVKKEDDRIFVTLIAQDSPRLWLDCLNHAEYLLDGLISYIKFRASDHNPELFDRWKHQVRLNKVVINREKLAAIKNPVGK